MRKTIKRIIAGAMALGMVATLMPGLSMRSEAAGIGVYIGNDTELDPAVASSIPAGVTYNADTKTLTLAGANVSAAYTPGAGGTTDYGIYIDSTNVEKLVLKGSNTVTVPNGDAGDTVYGVYSTGALTIDGTGTLTVSAGGVGAASYGISAGGALTIGSTAGETPVIDATGGAAATSNGIVSTGAITVGNGAQVTATADGTAAATTESFGIKATTLTINSKAEVTATGGGDNAIDAAAGVSGAVTIENGKLTAKANGGENNQAITGNVSAAGDSIISAEATNLTATTKGAGIGGNLIADGTSEIKAVSKNYTPTPGANDPFNGVFGTVDMKGDSILEAEGEALAIKGNVTFDANYSVKPGTATVKENNGTPGDWTEGQTTAPAKLNDTGAAWYTSVTIPGGGLLDIDVVASPSDGGTVTATRGTTSRGPASQVTVKAHADGSDSITATATANGGYTFIRWTDSATGETYPGSTITVTADVAKRLIATFVKVDEGGNDGTTGLKEDKTDDGKTDDGKTDDGKTDDGKTDDGKTDDGANTTGFADDSDIADYAKPYIKAAAEAGIVKGKENNRFDPRGGATRAEFATMIQRALGLKADKTESRFLDVKAPLNEDLINGVLACEDIDPFIVQGYPDGTFQPGKQITRAEGILMIWRAVGKPAYTGAAKFNDLADWYAEAANWGAEQGIVQGVGGGRFDGGATLTRQDLATMLGRAIEKGIIKLPTAAADDKADEAKTDGTATDESKTDESKTDGAADGEKTDAAAEGEKTEA